MPYFLNKEICVFNAYYETLVMKYQNTKKLAEFQFKKLEDRRMFAEHPQ